MSAHNPLDTSQFTITAEDFKHELDRVLEYVQLASARCDLPTLDDLFVETDTNRYWLLCYAIRFAARCAAQRVEGIARNIAEEALDSGAHEVSSPDWSHQFSNRLRKAGHPEDDSDIDIN